MRLIDYFAQGLRRGRDRPALIDGERVITWGEAADQIELLASAMAEAGFVAGDRIGVFSPNSATAFLAMLAALRLGAVWTPINARNSVEANAHWLRLVGCQALFYDSSLEAEALSLATVLASPGLTVCLDRDGASGAPSLQRFLERAGDPAPQPPDGPDVLASLFPTGGTTGLSKAAVWTHRTWEALTSAFWLCLPCETPPVHLVAGPMTHAAGGLALCALPGGVTNVILSKPDPAAILEAIERHRVTHLYLPPTLIYSLLDHPDSRRRDFSSLRYLVVAASPIAPARLREAMEVFGPVVCQSFGQAEAPMFLTFLSTRDLIDGPPERWSSCGRPTLASKVEIMGPDGELLADGERGEIVAQGSLVMLRYHDNPCATAEAGEHGWHHTGDIGYRDPDGFIHIVDRKKDMIITGGFNVFSAEVEQVILEHPAVLQCAVVGVPDAKWGEAIKAIIEVKAGAACSEADVISLVKQRLGSVHAPKSVEIWPHLPRSPAGKVLKREIRDGFWAEQGRAVG